MRLGLPTGVSPGRGPHPPSSERVVPRDPLAQKER